MHIAIKKHALALGFDACGIARADAVEPDAASRYDRWIEQGKNGCMEWASRNCEVRNDPRRVLEGAQSVIVVALNYYPAVFQPAEAPQFAYYAYGQDYHNVLKRRLKQLAKFIGENAARCRTRCCVDTVPLRERYWAQKAGVGFIGRNNALIVPGRGSYFFLGILLTTVELQPDAPCTGTCGDCGACMAACPTGALCDDSTVDARRCLSCLTIEHRGELPAWVAGKMGQRAYGCDECQRCCPHNRHAKPCAEPDLQPGEEFLALTAERILQMSDDDFRRIFGHSAVRRAGLEGLQRNVRCMLAGQHIQP